MVYKLVKSIVEGRVVGKEWRMVGNSWNLWCWMVGSGQLDGGGSSQKQNTAQWKSNAKWQWGSPDFFPSPCHRAVFWYCWLPSPNHCPVPTVISKIWTISLPSSIFSPIPFTPISCLSPLMSPLCRQTSLKVRLLCPWEVPIQMPSCLSPSTPFLLFLTHNFFPQLPSG